MSNPAAIEAAEDAYEDAMEGDDSRLSNAINEYIDAIRDRALEIARKEGGDAGMDFMMDLHNNIGATLEVGL